MEYIIEYLLYFVFVFLIYLHQIYEFKTIKKPKDKPEFLGAIVLLIILTIATKVMFSKTFEDELFLTHSFSKIINLYVNP